MADDRAARLEALSALAEPTRRRLYDHVVRQPEPVGRDDAAAALGIPRATVAFHLDRLADDGLLDVVRRRRTGRSGPGAGRPAKLYRRVEGAVAVSLPERRYDLAGELLAAALEEQGFEPRVEGGGVVLVNCPFSALAGRHPELVCGMNLGLLDGVLAGVGNAGLTARLCPGAGHCCVRLEPEPATR